MKAGEVKRIPVAVSIVVAMLVIGGMYVSGQRSDPNEHEAVRDALRRGGIREAARIKGHYVGEFDPHWDFGRFDIETLTKNSAVVIAGIPAKKMGTRLSSSGQTILTDYEIKVGEVFKGSVSARDSVTVSLPGGFIDFRDRTTAEVKTPEFEPMKLGATYTMFLSESDDRPDVYTLSGGPQGLVEIVDDTTLKSHGRPTDPVSKESKGKDKDTFLREARGESEKWPLPGKCCR